MNTTISYATLIHFRNKTMPMKAWAEKYGVDPRKTLSGMRSSSPLSVLNELAYKRPVSRVVLRRGVTLAGILDRLLEDSGELAQPTKVEKAKKLAPLISKKLAKSTGRARVKTKRPGGAEQFKAPDGAMYTVKDLAVMRGCGVSNIYKSMHRNNGSIAQFFE